MLSPFLRRLANAHSAIDPHLAMDLNNRLTLLYLRKHLGIKKIQFPSFPSAKKN